MENTITDKTVAIEILKHLGGNKFIAMTGARNFTCDNNGMGFMLPGTLTKNHINWVNIRLNCMDTYDMEFKNLRSGKIKIISTIEGVYNDMLQSIIEDRTGLCLNIR